MGPIDYSINVPNAFDSVMKGYETGLAINDMNAKRAQAAALQQKQEQQAQVINSLITNKNAGSEEYSQAMLLVPGMREQLKQAWETKNTGQQQQQLSDLSQWGAAIQNGHPDIAVDMMRQRADAIENTAGGKTRESMAMRTHADSIEAHPEYGGFMIKSLLAAHPEGSKVIDSIIKQNTDRRAEDQAPADLKKKEADARAAVAEADTKEVTASHAEEKAVSDLEKAGWDIKAIKSDIDYKKESNRIAAMNAAANRETNTLKRQELGMKIEDAKRDRDEKVRNNASQAETAASTIDNMLNTIERIKKSPGLNDVIGSLEGSDWYPNQAAATLNTLNPFTSNGDERANAIALIDTLGSQAFLSQVPMMAKMGNLSDAEGKKLGTGLQNLGRKQGEKQFRETLEETARLAVKMRNGISRQHGVPLSKPDTPAVSSAPAAAAVNRNIEVDF